MQNTCLLLGPHIWKFSSEIKEEEETCMPSENDLSFFCGAAENNQTRMKQKLGMCYLKAHNVLWLEKPAGSFRIQYSTTVSLMELDG
jgi:hypothetical protein